MRRAPLIVFLASVGCTLAPVDLDGRACPCAQGWTCVDVTQRCVRADRDGGDAGLSDAGPDAEPVDAGATDSGPLVGDSGPDGGPLTGDGGADAGAPTDAGPRRESVCAERVGDLFCDGFEQLSTAGWDGTVTEGGTLEAQAGNVYAGNGALLVRTTADGARVSVNASYPSVFSGSLYARGYFYLSSAADVEALSLLYLGETSPPYHGIAAQVLASGMQLFIGTDNAPVVFSTFQMPRDRWVCLQLAVEVHQGQGLVTATVDGTSLNDEVRRDTQPATGFSNVIAGLEYSPPEQGPVEFLVDEVIVSQSPIGCD